MGIAMSNELALAHVQGLRFLEDFSSRDFTWLVIGVLLAMAATWVISRRRRRWF
jgi:LPXTG-motif cell wall-anchored protein